MKTFVYLKNVLMLVVLLGIGQAMQAQTISQYTFAYTTPTYAAISGTALVSGVSSWDDNVYTAPLGFTFYFEGNPYTSVGVNSNGYIWFGTGTMSTSEYSPISTASLGTNVQGVVAVFATDLAAYSTSLGSAPTGTPDIDYITTGAAGAHVFTIQWKGTQDPNDGNAGSGGFGDVDRADFQIKLREADNSISVLQHINPYPYLGDLPPAEVGLRGVANTDFANLLVDCGTHNWNATANSNVSNASLCYAGASYCYPPTKSMFTWTPPVVTCPVVISNQASTNSTNCATPNGTITITATGGATTYTINAGTAITNTTGAFTGLAPGTYTVSAGNGTCSVNGTNITITGPTAPAAPTPGSNSPLCVGATLNLTASNVTNATYHWSGPNGFTSTSQNPSKANVQIADGGTYTVVDTVAGCVSLPASMTVTVNAGPTAPTAGSNSPICQGGTLNLTSTTVAGATYAWTGPNGFTSATQNPNRTGVTTLDGGDYIVVATVTGCAPVSDTVTVTITPGPPAITASNTGPVCAGQLVQVNSSTVASVTYAWTGPNGFTSSVQNPPAFTASAATAGDYIVTISNGGCGTSSDTTTVVVNPVPTAPIINSNSPLCAGQTLNLTVAAQTGATYAWSGPNGFTSTSQTPSISNVTTADAGNYVVTVTIGTCGSKVDSTIVAIGAGAPPVTATNNGPICTGQTLQLNVTNVTGATYSWSGPNGFSASTANPTKANVSNLDAGTYHVTVTSGSCGSSIDSTTVSVVTSPAVPTVRNNSPVCIGQTVTLTSSVVPGATYAWSGPNNFSGNSDTVSITNVTLADNGVYTITASVPGCGSVTNSTTVTISSGLPANDAVITANISPLCQGDTLHLSVPVTAGASYQWSGPNNYVSILRNPSRAGTDSSFTGTYSVTVTQNGCTVSSSQAVAVSDTPTVKAGSSGSYCFGDTVVFNAGSFLHYVWSSGDTTRTETAGATGTYSITVTDFNGCVGHEDINFVRLPKPDTTTFQQIGDSLISSWDTASGYQWFLNGDSVIGANGKNIVITQSGDYSLVVTDGNGCSTRSETIHADYVGIDEMPLSSNLEIYPNPATGKFNIHGLGNIDKNVKMVLYNAIGAKVMDNNYHISSGQTIQVNIDQLAQGVYMIQLQAGNQTFTKKLVVQ